MHPQHIPRGRKPIYASFSKSFQENTMCIFPHYSTPGKKRNFMGGGREIEEEITGRGKGGRKIPHEEEHKIHVGTAHVVSCQK